MKSVLCLFVLLMTASSGALAQAASGSVLKDCEDVCPDMVVIPSGTFKMGMKDYDWSQKPVHKAKLAAPFAVSRTEVTFSQWNACVADTACKPVPDADEEHDDQPVVNVSWKGAQTYIAWLSAKTGHIYRLPSETEWEYVARIGLAPDGFGTGAEAVDRITPNRLGLIGMYAVPNEWVADCYVDDYKNFPTDGSAYDEVPCFDRSLRGGLKFQISPLPRVTFRQHAPDDHRNDTLGFRVARDL